MEHDPRDARIASSSTRRGSGCTAASVRSSAVVQHAHMAMEVLAAATGGASAAWLANMAKPARTPMHGPAASGIAGVPERVSARAATRSRAPARRVRLGPDLTHLASRSTLAARHDPEHPA